MDRVKSRSGVSNTIKTAIKVKPYNAWFNSQCFTVANVLKIIVFLALCLFIYKKSSQSQQENDDSLLYLASPKVDDIYFLDMGIFEGKIEGKSKYRLAKVIRLTDDNLAIVYGKFSYQWQYSVKNSIQYGDLSNDDYFMPLPDYIPLNKVEEMRASRAIYLVKRPIRNQLYGNFVRP